MIVPLVLSLFDRSVEPLQRGSLDLNFSAEVRVRPVLVLEPELRGRYSL